MIPRLDSKLCQKIIVSLSFLGLAACGVLGGGSTGPSGSSDMQMRELPRALQTAICEGRAQEAVDALLAEPLFSPSDRFYTALALEEAGAGPRARIFYAGVMQTNANEYVKARCPDRILADGPVVSEAARRLAALSQNLAAMDVNLAPSRPLHNGLPASASPIKSINSYSYTGSSSQTVERPQSQSPLGQWFAHLVSYRSMENAMENRATLEKKFPALSGILDQWELNVGGSAAIRLGVRVSQRADADSLCNAVKSQGDYCAVIDTSR